MRNKILFVLVCAGVLAGLLSAYIYARPQRPLPPAFSPAQNPYDKGIFANGIIESYQSNGKNVNLYPEVAGTVTQILVTEGQHVTKGTPLLAIDDSIQRAVVEQQASQAQAALALLEELRAQPRRETLEVTRAQMELSAASLKSGQDQLDKQKRAFDVDPRAVSKDVLDNATNAVRVAQANLEVATRQYQLAKAGAWSYDIKNQERQYDALTKAVAASTALLGKYTLKAAADGAVLSIQTAVGSYVSPQGSYDTYTQSMAPVLVMGNSSGYLGVRCYIDEILIPRLPSAAKIQARMFIRGTSTSIPLEFVRVQPYVSPKIELSNGRQEKVDLRVLPVLFRFALPKGTDSAQRSGAPSVDSAQRSGAPSVDSAQRSGAPSIEVYPGELVDVYVGEK